MKYFPDFLRETVHDAVPQLVDLFKDVEGDVCNTAMTVFGKLAQLGQ
jgi:hypothetical protein